MLPESIDYTRIGPLLLAALERRHARRRGDDPPRQLRALVIARRFNIRPRGSDDSRKRAVRLVIEQLRRDGAAIASTFAGYYIPSTADDFARNREFRKRSGLAHLAASAAMDRSAAHADATGQLALFNGPAKAAR